MNDVKHFNSAHLMYLVPLIKWRILDLQTLRDECLHKKNYFNFARIIRKLESLKIINGYKHPYNKKKYIYLSPYGESLLGGKENPTAVSKDSLLHDIKVAQLSRDFRRFENVNEVSLEHQLSNARNIQMHSGLIPDALIEVLKNNKKVRFALELELTQKSKVRIYEKAKQYFISHRYDYVIYFFASKSLMEKYQKIIFNKFSEDKTKKILFLYSEGLTKNSNTLEDTKSIVNGKEFPLESIFGKLNAC